jgi:hypothetical protein
MEEFRCNLCNYKTNDKSNYRRHIKSQKHKKKLIYKKITQKNSKNSKLTQNLLKKLKNSSKDFFSIYVCEYCGCKFKRKWNYDRHDKTCKLKKIDKIDKENKINILEKKLEEKESEITKKNNEIENQKIIIAEAEKVVIKTININDRITKYLEMNYSNVPALLPPTNEQIEEVIEIKNKDEEFCFGKYFLVNIDELVKIIGKIIVGIYKNEENIFSTDISRLSFYIRAKELIRKNKEEMIRWIKDPKGIKLKEVIIEPIIKYMMDEIKSYFNKIKMKEAANIKTITEKNEELRKITDIMIKDKEELANNIVKDIAPIFKLK